MQFTVRLAIDVAERAPQPRTVLVLSEDQDWRDVLRRVLEQEGYRVLTARHPGHALITCISDQGTVDLLVSDGAQGRRRSDFPSQIFRDNPALKLLHLDARPRDRDDLLALVSNSLQKL